jgi:hypothetical protein
VGDAILKSPINLIKPCCDFQISSLILICYSTYKHVKYYTNDDDKFVRYI